MRLDQILAMVLGAHTLLVATESAAQSADLCKAPVSDRYAAAMRDYPYLKEAIATVANQAIASWYTDRTTDIAVRSRDLFAGCATGARPTIVVYGLPQKDCDAGFSSDGANTNSTMYRQFLQDLADKAAGRPIVYILEPDAVGLLTNNGCGNTAGYADNLRVALDVLGSNANADIYIDIGYWTLGDDSQAAKVAAVVKQIDVSGRCKGISLNTSNYRPVSEMSAACQRFAKAANKGYRCIVDTSRNYVAPPSFEWCNSRTGGIGVLPAKNPVPGLIDYYVWAKPPGDSDGACSGRTADALPGPSAGVFFPEHFVSLWNNGLFVQQQGKVRLDAAKIHVNTTAAVTPTCSIQEGVDYAGNDIASVLATTAEACCSICANRAGCGAFSWTALNGGTCWLKSGKGTTSWNGSVRSAVVSLTLMPTVAPTTVAPTVTPTPAATPAPLPSTCSIQENVDFPGNDIASTLATTAEACCAICWARTGCGAFSWTSYNGGTCWLKSGKTTTGTSSGVRSAVVTASVCSPLQSGVDYTGNDLSSAQSTTASGCCALCKNKAGCKAFTWTSYSGGTCWLKSAKTTTVATTGVISGTVT